MATEWPSVIGAAPAFSFHVFGSFLCRNAHQLGGFLFCPQDASERRRDVGSHRRACHRHRQLPLLHLCSTREVDQA
jgi:hypothetical protein